VTRCTLYIGRQLALGVAAVTLVLTGVVWLSQSLRFIDFIVNKGLSAAGFLKLTLLLLPTFLGLVLPVALFCAVVHAYNRLAVDRELVVLRAAGLGPRELARPALLVAALVALMLLAVMLYLMPAGYRAFKDQQYVIREDLTHILLQEGTFNSFGTGLTVYVREIESTGEAVGILVHDERDRANPVTMMAERGTLVRSEAGPRLLLVNGNRQAFDRASRSLGLLYFDRYTFDLSLVGTPVESRWREPRERYLDELFGPPRREEDVTNASELRAEGHHRIVTPLSAFGLALIALAALLAGEFNRRGQAWRLAAAVTLGGLFEAGLLVLERAIIKVPAATPALYALVLGAPLAAWAVLRMHRWPRWRGLQPAG